VLQLPFCPLARWQRLELIAAASMSSAKLRQAKGEPAGSQGTDSNSARLHTRLGQLLSARPDVCPSAYVAELASLQDKVAGPSPSSVVETLLEQELGERCARSF